MTTEFKREHNRYEVIKCSDLSPDELDLLREFIEENEIRTREAVVIEFHWPIYEETWENVQRLAEGRPSIGQERDGLASHLERLKKMFMAGADDEEIGEVLSNTPFASLGHRDGELLSDTANQLEDAEGPDAEAGDMWDASQCAQWIREQAELRRQANGGA
jgi:hypothetical protein